MLLGDDPVNFYKTCFVSFFFSLHTNGIQSCEDVCLVFVGSFVGIRQKKNITQVTKLLQTIILNKIDDSLKCQIVSVLYTLPLVGRQLNL